jgi:uncharacterized phage protein (TIGR02218 family)
MKTISAPLKAHLEQAVTTLATIWQLTRTDGEEFFFTDLDRDIDYGGDTYRARSGYNRSAVNNDVGLSVDNLEVEGVFNSDDITEIDLRAGLFDNCEVKISLVNWSDLSQGVLKQRRGRLGEVSLSQKGIFKAELRGLTQQLSQTICGLYQAECRADLGDPKCAVFIRPTVLGRSQDVAAGETFRVVTKSTTSILWDQLVNNGVFDADAEAADTVSVTGWEVLSGVMTITSNSYDLTASSGSLFVVGGRCSSFEMRQDISLVNTFGINLTEVDAENVTADFSCMRANSAPDDTGRVLVQFLDSSGNPISTMYDTGDEEILPEDTWASRLVSAVAVPTGTRTIRIRFMGTLITGLIVNSCIDDVQLSLTDTVTDNTYEDLYENRMYEVTTAGTTDVSQPAYSTTVDASTTDGTAVLICKEAWSRSAVVSSVNDRKNIKLEVSDTRANDDGWFNYGALVIESGLNTGRVTEIKNWDATTRVLTVYLPISFEIYSGTKVRLYPGCDKRLETCTNKFNNVLNYRGEPFVPGQDELISYASAGSY